jgi:hypothetical protein
LATAMSHKGCHWLRLALPEADPAQPWFMQTPASGANRQIRQQRVT